MGLRLRSVAVMVSVALPVAGLLTACGTASTPTCAEFNKMSFSDQGTAEQDLLRKHGLDPYSTSNVAGLTADITSYCGVSFGNSNDSTNSNSSIDNAVSDWNATTW